MAEANPVPKKIAKRMSLPKGAISYIMQSYGGTRPNPKTGKGIERVFKWLDETGKNWTTGIRDFAAHLEEKFELPRRPHDEMIHKILRAHGKVVLHQEGYVPPKKRRRTPTGRRRRQVTMAITPRAVPADQLGIGWDNIKTMVKGLVDALPDAPENRAFVSRLGSQLWGQLSGLKGG
jgi:hypothetical protein